MSIVPFISLQEPLRILIIYKGTLPNPSETSERVWRLAEELAKQKVRVALSATYSDNCAPDLSSSLELLGFSYSKRKISKALR